MDNLHKLAQPFVQKDDKIKAILVPHADWEYSGLCAMIAFCHIPESYNHFTILYVDHSGKGTNDHSYQRIVEMLYYFFKNPTIQALNSSEFNDFKPIPNSFIIATSDLTHYGKSYGSSSFNPPEQYRAQQNEEDLLVALQKGIYPSDNLFTNVSACGKRNIQKLSELVQLKGKIVFYSDSTKKNIQPSSPHFVNYLSMIFTDTIGLTPFDKLYGLIIIKNAVEFKTRGGSLQWIPKWSFWNSVQQGAFVGIMNKNEIRGSVGNYQFPNIAELAESCYYDAERRWGGKITKEELSQLSYHINLLDPISEWKSPDINNIKKCLHGIHLTMKNGNQATYLPSVWCERPHWSIQDVLKHLSEKAGGLEIKDIKTYETELIKIQKNGEIGSMF